MVPDHRKKVRVGDRVNARAAGPCCHRDRAVLGSTQQGRHKPSPARARGMVAAEGGKDGECRSEEHTSELQSRQYLVCRLLLEKKKMKLTVETGRAYV